MTELFRQANDDGGVTAADNDEHRNRDNRLASVLHFMCTLVKDGELKAPLIPYMCDIFSIAIGTIESKEWTVRNAALQLFGAIVPKLVGQTQYFENTIDWLPVYIVYTDLVTKSYAMHERILQLLQQCTRPSVLLVALLELLSRIEVIDDAYNGEPAHLNRFRQMFYAYLRYDCEKIRTLAARCLARWHKFVEIPGFVGGVVEILLNRSTDENQRHGLISVVMACLKKYESDVRFTQFDEGEKVAETIRNIFEINWTTSTIVVGGCSYYLRIYLMDLLTFVGFDRMDSSMMRLCLIDAAKVGRSTAKDVRQHINEMEVISDADHFGFNQWKSKMLKLYDDNKDDDGVPMDAH